MEDSLLQSVNTHIRRVESECDVRVLYACESGSRAWGFASTDSDYDVRFIYVHPRDWYFSIEDRRDVIEQMLPGDLDLSGWELRKALRLLRKSNPSLLEWLYSPLVYHQNAEFIEELRLLAGQCYSARNCFAHYFSYARGNYLSHLRGPEVRLKKYLYVLRPILAAQWIERGLGKPPVLFEQLYELLVPPGEVREALMNLLERKRNADELAVSAPIAPLQNFIEAELARLATTSLPESEFCAIETLNQFFRRWVKTET